MYRSSWWSAGSLGRHRRGLGRNPRLDLGRRGRVGHVGLVGARLVLLDHRVHPLVRDGLLDRGRLVHRVVDPAVPLRVDLRGVVVQAVLLVVHDPAAAAFLAGRLQMLS